MVMDTVDQLAKTIWDYMLMHHTMKPMDAIFVLGSSDKRIAERAVELWKSGYSKYIIFSGGRGKDFLFEKTEAETLADVAVERGVPKKNIIIENQATNTGENILFTQNILKEKGLNFKSFILVHKPYMERRAYATFAKQWPGAKFIVTSPAVPFNEYSRDPEEKERFINLMVGDLQRIREYPKLGFQIEQDIPKNVWDANDQLIKNGYTRFSL